MTFHDPGENIALLRQGEGFHSFFTGKGLETKLAEIAEKVRPIFGIRFSAVPHLPEMTVPVVFVLGIDEVPAGGGGGGHIADLRTYLPYNSGENILKNGQIVLKNTLIILGDILILNVVKGGFLHFIVAADQADAGMMSDAKEILTHLCGKDF